VLEQIKVLNGILALDKFTAGDLASYTQVKLPTVYTVLKRRQSLLDPIGPEATGRRGGKSIRYRLKPEAVDALQKEISKAAAAVARERRESTTEQEAAWSLNLESAEEFLTYRIKQAQNIAEKRSLLDTANVYLTAAQVEFQERFGEQDTVLARERASRLKALSALSTAIATEIAEPSEIADDQRFLGRYLRPARRYAAAAKEYAAAAVEGMVRGPQGGRVARATAFAQGRIGPQMGDVAPDFETDTTQGHVRFHDWIGDSWVVLLSHPADFTPVSPTEIARLVSLQPEFEKRNVKVIGLTVDLVEHSPEDDWFTEWFRAMEDVLGFGLNYPMIKDPDLKIASCYGIVHRHGSGIIRGMVPAEHVARSVFIIGPDKKIKIVMAYPITTGRNFDEVLRVIDSVQLTAKHKVATPVNWKQGDALLIAGSVSDAEMRGMFSQGLNWYVSTPSATRQR
jgi:alkyl hydroperoxide reductase subunit AhpC